MSMKTVQLYVLFFQYLYQWKYVTINDVFIVKVTLSVLRFKVLNTKLWILMFTINIILIFLEYLT